MAELYEKRASLYKDQGPYTEKNLLRIAARYRECAKALEAMELTQSPSPTSSGSSTSQETNTVNEPPSPEER